MPREKTKRPLKLENVIEKVRQHVSEGKIIDTRHSGERQKERLVTFPEIIQVLKNGWHEKVKDEWKAEYKSWNYSIRGQTLDGVELRVPVFFDDEEPSMSYFGIVTVIKLNK